MPALFGLGCLLAACTPVFGQTLPGTSTNVEKTSSPTAHAVHSATASPTLPPFAEQTPAEAASNQADAAPTAAAALDGTPTESAPQPAALTLPPDRLPPEDWQNWPVIPQISARALEIYKAGIALGNNPQAFSRVGDCQNVTDFFLGPFDHPKRYDLGSYPGLQGVITYYAGSFERVSAAVKGGFNVASVLNPINSDPKRCQNSETPIACEFRLNKPTVAIISMETWWSHKPTENYEKYLRQIVDFTIAQGVVPILATKADNLEGDNSINLRIARVAFDYDIPLWNFWQAVQPLPTRGLWSDGFHLTNAPDHQFFFSDPLGNQTGIAVRNLTALQTLDAFWKAAQPETKP